MIPRFGCRRSLKVFYNYEADYNVYKMTFKPAESHWRPTMQAVIDDFENSNELQCKRVFLIEYRL
jgi:hypothetical protein